VSIYYTDLTDVLRGAGLTVRENATTNGWQSRARSSGGFAAAPLGVFWHHTASSTSPESDLAYMINGSSDAPVGNMLIDRDGACWPIAAGASNCAGKGGPATFSRGTAPVDAGNSTCWQIEAANNGVGEPWPQAQIDAFFAASNALNARFGNLPTDVITHALGAGDGWTDRKIDPATAPAVQGPWRPSSVTSSGTWSLADIRADCDWRATPQPPEVPDMTDEQAAQLAALYSGLVQVGGNAGQTDPAGNPTNTPWLLWYVNLGQQALDQRIQALQLRVEQLAAER
jgi:hypothetical protein